MLLYLVASFLTNIYLVVHLIDLASLWLICFFVFITSIQFCSNNNFQLLVFANGTVLSCTGTARFRLDRNMSTTTKPINEHGQNSKTNPEIMKYLGIHIGPLFTWNVHPDNVCKIISSDNFLIWTLKKLLIYGNVYLNGIFWV